MTYCNKSQNCITCIPFIKYSTLHFLVLSTLSCLKLLIFNFAKAQLIYVLKISNGTHTYCKTVLLAAWPLNIRNMIAIPIKKLNVPTPTDVAANCSIFAGEWETFCKGKLFCVFFQKVSKNLFQISTNSTRFIYF